MSRFKTGDKVKFIPENYEWDLLDDTAAAYQEVIGLVGTVVVVTDYLPYPYEVSYGLSDTLLFTEKELELVNEI